MKTRVLSILFVVAAVAFTTCCSGSKAKIATFPIGEKVRVGKLSYQVVEASWQTEVPGVRQAPKNRILQIHVTVTNAGSAEVSIPMLRLVDAAGNEIGEITEIEGNGKWMGMIRRMQPALTEEGLVYFDVPVGAYKLEVVDTSIADSEQVAFIEIPASLAPPPSMPGAKGI